MDHFDLEILNSLQADARRSTEELGEQIGLSASACQRRIKKLKTSGVIDKEVAVINSSKLPSYITIIVDIILEKGGEKILDKVIGQFNSEPQVQQIYYVAGEADFVIVVICQNMEAFDQLSRRLFMDNNNIKKFISKVAIQSCKVGTALPLG